jgi:hypothetical protein
MRFFSILALAVLGASACPTNKGDYKHRNSDDHKGKCMSSKEATDSVETYRQLIAEYTPELGEKWVASSFVEYSDSINTFIHKKLGTATFPNKQAFMASQAVTPHFPVTILSVDAVQCNTVAIQWKSAFGAANLPAKGITTFKTVFEDDRWKISEINVEFNSVIWLLNMGGSYTWEGKTYTPTSPDATLL